MTITYLCINCKKELGNIGSNEIHEDRYIIGAVCCKKPKVKQTKKKQEGNISNEIFPTMFIIALIFTLVIVPLFNNFKAEGQRCHFSNPESKCDLYDMEVWTCHSKTVWCYNETNNIQYWENGEEVSVQIVQEVPLH